MKQPTEMDLTTLISSQQTGPEDDYSGGEKVVNQILVELKGMKTGWRAAFKSQAEVDRYKQQLLKACYEKGINTIELVNIGLEKARDDESDFLPSVGKFTNWCKPKKPREHHEHQAMTMAEKYSKKNRQAKRLEDQSPERRKELARKHIAEMRKLNLRG